MKVQVYYGFKIVHPSMPPPFWDERWLKPKYRMRRRWGFWWDVQEHDQLRDMLNYDPPEWRRIARYRSRDEAIAHLVKLKLEGKEVEL